MRLITIFIFLFITSISAEEPSKELNKKLDIVIPEVKFEDVRFKDAIDQLRELSKRYDPGKTGINIIYLDKKITQRVVNQEAPEEDDPFAEADPFAEDDPFADPNAPRGELEKERGLLVTLDAEEIPIRDCFKYICDNVNAQYRYDKNAVVVSPSATPPICDGWNFSKLKDKNEDLTYRIKQLQKELALIKAIQNLPKPEDKNIETLNENIVFPKVRFQNASLSFVEEYIERQSALLSKNKEKNIKYFYRRWKF